MRAAKSFQLRELHSRQYLPRKGTETLCKSCTNTPPPDTAFPTIFTPQGDGNRFNFPTSLAIAPIIPDNIYPARGRKQTIDSSTLPTPAISFPTIFTPQGDGNIALQHCCAVGRCREHSRQYLPRKGTETDCSKPSKAGARP